VLKTFEFDRHGHRRHWELLMDNSNYNTHSLELSSEPPPLALPAHVLPMRIFHVLKSGPTCCSCAIHPICMPSQMNQHSYWFCVNKYGEKRQKEMRAERNKQHGPSTERTSKTYSRATNLLMVCCKVEPPYLFAF
jgi:hypothetical protein